MVVKDGVTVDDVIKKVSSVIGRDWKSLARQLNFTKQTDIDAIELDNNCNLKEQIAQLFIQWKRREGPGATSQFLVDALRKADLQCVLMELEEDIIHKEGTLFNMLNFFSQKNMSVPSIIAFI